ncbi:MAG TPA: hypothetical protein VG269_06245 [Tepidisphaeraceae bacterium]|jgi:hypothetical protein|nr:hypothetical protein [Tepidisphaeraceae bacterium]
MTASLAKAFVKASRLPEAAQEQLAEQVLNDIRGELKWDQALADSQDLLEQLASKARSAKQQGKTTKKGIDEL